jgi:hypothetical protein
MGVFLTILKIIGFVLLGIIALILLIFAVILFWPFFYKIEGSYYKEPKAKFQLNYLFHAIRIIVKYEDEVPLLQAKVLWFTVYEKNIIDLIKGEDEAEGEGGDVAPDLPDDLPEDLQPADEQTEDSSASAEEGQGEDAEPELDELSDEEIEDYMTFAKAPKIKLPKSVDEIYDNIEKFVQKIAEKWYNVKRNVTDLQKKVRYYTKLVKYYWRLLHHKSVKPAFIILKKTVVRMIKHVWPRKARIYIHYGADNPADTAKAVAYYSMIYPYFPKQIRFDADFNNKIIEGEGYLKGRFHVIVFVVLVLRMYLNKNVRKVIALIIREVKRHG